MKPIRTFDLETDPFQLGRLPCPFCYGLYEPSRYISYWGDDCIEHFYDSLDSIEPGYIYAHNGGKFDFLFLLPYVDKSSSLRIVNGRILECRIKDHVFRDSYALMPFALAKYKKTDIDYTKLEKQVRKKHKAEILSYLKDDCANLHELVTTFVDTFGMQLTVGSTAMKEIRKRHDFEKSSEKFDRSIREHYYFGGRNQCFKSGVIQGHYEIYDVNSMYPFVMRDKLHPVSASSSISDRIEPDTAFVTVRGLNRGAFCQRTKTGLDFTLGQGLYHTTIGEYETAVETGTFKTEAIIETVGFDRRECFDNFVNDFYEGRKTFRKNGDETRAELYKYVLNSGYGKFAQNPDNYMEWKIMGFGEHLYEKCPCATDCNCKRSNSCTVCDKDFFVYDEDCPLCFGSGNLWSEHETANDYSLWKRPAEAHNYYNVATGASITGWARATLLKGLSQCVDPIYCDTDSVIAKSFAGNINPDELGAWKHEGSADLAAIAGKKLYALFSLSQQIDKKTGKEKENFKIGSQKVWLVKKACKGANLTGRQILHIAKGGEVKFESDVPQFKISGDHKFVAKNLKRTAWM